MEEKKSKNVRLLFSNLMIGYYCMKKPLKTVVKVAEPSTQKLENASVTGYTRPRGLVVLPYPIPERSSGDESSKLSREAMWDTANQRDAAGSRQFGPSRPLYEELQCRAEGSYCLDLEERGWGLAG